MVNLQGAIAAVVGGLVACSVVVASPSARADDTVAKAQSELSGLQIEAAKAQVELEQSRKDLTQAQADYDVTTADLADQRVLVDTLRVQVGRVAVAAQQQAASMGTASLLFSSDSEESFIADMKVMQSVTSLTDEQLARLAAEQDRLAELESTQASTVEAINAEIAEQEKLTADYDGKVAQAKSIVDALSASQKSMLESKASQAVIDENMKLLNSAMAEASGRSSRSASGDPLGAGIWPTSGPITSPFGYRTNPIGGYTELHDGVDIAPPCGTPVMASWTGVVLSARTEGGWGNRVIIDSGTYKTAYAHLQSMSVSPGDVVQAGQVVGAVGTTGFSTGCHLHFSTWVNNQITDPTTVIKR